MLDTKFRENPPAGSGEKIFEGFLAHLSPRLIGELIVYEGIRRPYVVRPCVRRPSSVCKHFQTTSPLKP